jgi:hypothetical protein
MNKRTEDIKINEDKNVQETKKIKMPDRLTIFLGSHNSSKSPNLK